MHLNTASLLKHKRTLLFILRDCQNRFGIISHQRTITGTAVKLWDNMKKPPDKMLLTLDSIFALRTYCLPNIMPNEIYSPKTLGDLPSMFYNPNHPRSMFSDTSDTDMDPSAVMEMASPRRVSMSSPRPGLYTSPHTALELARSTSPVRNADASPARNNIVLYVSPKTARTRGLDVSPDPSPYTSPRRHHHASRGTHTGSGAGTGTGTGTGTGADPTVHGGPYGLVFLDAVELTRLVAHVWARVLYCTGGSESEFGRERSPGSLRRVLGGGSSGGSGSGSSIGGEESDILGVRHGGILPPLLLPSRSSSSISSSGSSDAQTEVLIDLDAERALVAQNRCGETYAEVVDVFRVGMRELLAELAETAGTVDLRPKSRNMKQVALKSFEMQAPRNVDEEFSSKRALLDEMLESICTNFEMRYKVCVAVLEKKHAEAEAERKRRLKEAEDKRLAEEEEARLAAEAAEQLRRKLQAAEEEKERLRQERIKEEKEKKRLAILEEKERRRKLLEERREKSRKIAEEERRKRSILAEAGEERRKRIQEERDKQRAKEQEARLAKERKVQEVINGAKKG